jgi:hypothetical protein
VAPPPMCGRMAPRSGPCRSRARLDK